LLSSDAFIDPGILEASLKRVGLPPL